MATRVGFSVAGDPEVRAALEGVRDGVRNRVLKEAIKRVAEVGKRKAKERLRRKRTRQLFKSLGMRPKSYQRGKVFVVVLGPRRGFRIKDDRGRTIDPTKYAHLVERGRKGFEAKGDKPLTFLIYRGRGKGRFRRVRRVKAVRGVEFLGDALDMMRLRSPWIMRRAIAVGIAEQAAKYRAKGQSIRKG